MRWSWDSEPDWLVWPGDLSLWYGSMKSTTDSELRCWFADGCFVFCFFWCWWRCFFWMKRRRWCIFWLRWTFFFLFLAGRLRSLNFFCPNRGCSWICDCFRCLTVSISWGSGDSSTATGRSRRSSSPVNVGTAISFSCRPRLWFRARVVPLVVVVVVVVDGVVVVIGVVVVVVVVEGCEMTMTLSLGGCWNMPRISMNFLNRSLPLPTSWGAAGELPEALRPCGLGNRYPLIINRECVSLPLS